MNKKLVVKEAVKIKADSARIWEALTNPDQVKIYLFGTNLNCTWNVNDPITFTGEYNGVSYVDKGVVLKCVQPVCIEYTYWSSFSGIPDVPENYSLVRYEISQVENESTLTVIQTGFTDRSKQEHSVNAWKHVLNTIKELCEK